MAADLNTVTVGGVTYSKADYDAMQASKGSTNRMNDALDKDAFLQLLVTQMQYQDPLDPQDNPIIWINHPAPESMNLMGLRKVGDKLVPFGEEQWYVAYD